MIRKIRRSLHIRDAHVAWIVSLLLQAPSTGPVFGQTEMGDALGAIYVSSTPNEHTPYATPDYVSPFVVGTFYIVADIDFADAGAPDQNALNGIQAWEGRVEFPPELFLVEAEFEGTSSGETDLDFVVDVGLPIVLANSLPRPLVTLRCLTSTEVELFSQIRLVPSTSPPAKGVIGWLEALDSNGCLDTGSGAAAPCFYPFEFVGSLTFDLEGATEEGSWTSVKQMFR